MTPSTLILASAIAILLLGIGFVLWTGRRRARIEGGIGFFDYVRNPSYRREMGNARSRQEQVIEELSVLPPTELVARLLDDHEIPVTKSAIHSAGPAIVPALIDALSNPAFLREIDEETQEKAHMLEHRTTPVGSVLECLGEFAPSEAAGPVSHLIDHEHEEIRKEAALLLGAIGTDATIAPLQKALSDEDEFVRSYALMGIMRGEEAGRLSPTFRRALFESVQSRLSEDDHASQCLLKLDKDRATGVLTRPEYMRPDRDRLHRSLQALREADVTVDEDALLGLLDAVEDDLDKYPNDYVAGESLLLLARHDSNSAVAAIQKATESDNKDVRDRAYLALGQTQGLSDPLDDVLKRLDEVDWSGLTKTQRNIAAVWFLIAEVDNGGFAQYFVNSSGDQWRAAMAGLEAIGAHEDLELLKKAVAYFGKDGPDTDNTKRHHQLARIVRRKGNSVFDRLENVFYEDKQGRESLLLKYAISHRKELRDD